MIDFVDFLCWRNQKPLRGFFRKEGKAKFVQHIPNPWPFMDLDNLSRLLASGATPSIVDARAERAYSAGHLPGAVNLPARDLNVDMQGVRQLIGAQELKKRLNDLGIGTNVMVVYGAKGGSDAAHVWWTLHAYGHPRVYLLDGGIEAWQEAGLQLNSEVPSPQPPEPEFEPTLNRERLITLDELKERLDDPTLSFLDTRNPSEFYGEDVAAKHGGHIPGAILFPWDEAMTGDWRLKPGAELQEMLEPYVDAPEVAIYCQSGVRAAHTYAVLKKLGHPKPRLYLGSWGEWGNRDDTPIEKGGSP